MTRPEALIFDLFGTLVFFDDSRVPTMEVAGRTVPMTIRDLPELLRRHVPHVELSHFLAELRSVSSAVAEQKRRESIELHTSVRFERTLAGLGVEPAKAAEAAAEMARLHMETLGSAVVCPPGRTALLETLASSYPLALVSNFDDAATARRVLAHAGLDRYFGAIVISDEEGLRKPSRVLFERACSAIGKSPSACLYVGDTLRDDIHGACDAGLMALWIHHDPQAASPAAGILADVDGLPGWLANRLSGPGGA